MPVRSVSSLRDSVSVLGWVDALGLRRDVALDELLRRWINSDLAGDKYQASGADGLGIWADCLGSVGGGDYIAHDIAFE